MVRRVTSAQFQALVRQAQQKQQRAISEYNSAVRRYNSEVQRRSTNVRRAIDSYNREARAHNARVAADQRRLRSELERLSTDSVVVRSSTYYVSVTALHRWYEEVETNARGTWLEQRDDILDLAQAETSNSLAVASALDIDVLRPSGAAVDPVDPAFEARLTGLSEDLAARWRGAIFALNPHNPDAARHFSASSREILSRIIDQEAPDQDVISADPDCPRTDDGRPTRRARLAFCLTRAGRASESLSAFADADVVNILELFRVFNDGTHGSSGLYDLRHLGLIRRRVEGAVVFLHSILRET